MRQQSGKYRANSEARMYSSMRSSALGIGSAFRRLWDGKLNPAKAGMFGTLGNLRNLRLAFHNPLTADAPWSAINRFLRFRIARRVCGLSIVVPYVNDTKLIVDDNISMACFNPIYMGLPDLEYISFVLHLLTDDDLFGDIGAHIGLYSVAASGVCGGKTVAVEPVPNTAAALRLNIAINGLGGLVDILEIGIGAEAGELSFSTNEGGCNHVLEDKSGCRVPVLPLDEVFAARTPVLLKIDVEGYETSVIKGGQRLLEDVALKAVVMELAGVGARYGFDERALDSEMRRFGFKSFSYDPWSRKLNPSAPTYDWRNPIYVRDLAFVEDRLRTARRFRVLNCEI
jgi:FkbM family methyltransferase